MQPKTGKNADKWVEFDFGNINLSLILLDNEEWQGNCIP